MEKKTAMKWVKALRSGKFKQKAGTLVSVEENHEGETEKILGYCCLGVLGEVCGMDKGDLIGVDFLDAGIGGLKSGIGSFQTGEGEEVYKGIALRDRTNKVRRFSNLADANDAGVSFRRIATWIEKNYKNL